MKQAFLEAVEQGHVSEAEVQAVLDEYEKVQAAAVSPSNDRYGGGQKIESCIRSAGLPSENEGISQ